MSKRRKEPADLSANLTSLIDVTFLLIVFFVLVSKINDVERTTDLKPPQVPNPLSELAESEHRVVINVIPAPAGRVASYLVGLSEFAGDDAGLAGMTDHLTRLYQTNPSIDVNVRADRATHYEFVEPVLQAVSTAAIKSGIVGVSPRVNLVVTKGS